MFTKGSDATGRGTQHTKTRFFFLFVIVMKKPILSRTESANTMSNTKIYEKEGFTGNEQSPTLVCIY